jgi:nitrate/nitrite transport system substrate-binding protein
MGVEVREVKVRFIPILCAAPLVYATRRGIFEQNGLSVQLQACPGWSGVKELLVHDRIDAAHLLAPMALSTTLGLDGKPVPLRLCAIQNVNGQALILAKAHHGLQQVRDMRGFRFGVPYLFSMHYYLLCDFLAKHGLDPLHDVKIEEIAPPRMPNYIRTGRVDAVLSPEPFAELMVSDGSGTLFSRSNQFWPGHPCCSGAVTKAFSDANPETCAALVRSLVEAEYSLREYAPTRAGGRSA